MARRTERICVYPRDKTRLKEIREDVFGTSSVPLGVTVEHLMDDFEDN